MVTATKHILCAFQNQDQEILRAIYCFAQKHHWLIEACGATIPPDWDGDGVISDYLTLEDLAHLHRPNEIPILSRSLPPAANIRCVLSDTNAVAELALNFFLARGFRYFVALATIPYPGFVCGIPITPNTALEMAAKKRNLKLVAYNCMQTFGDPYPETQAKLKRFLLQLPHPTALIATSGRSAGVICRALSELELKVPEEIAILCNSEDPLTTEFPPVPLSCISGEHPTVGLRLAETMQKMLNHEEVPLAPLLVGPSTIIERASTNVLAVPHTKLAAAIHFLLQNRQSPVGISDAAQYAELSQSMLNRLFRRHLNTTATEFQRELKLNHIIDLLLHTDLNLQEIAHQSGYSSSVSLSLAFRRATGMQPGAYRLTHRVNPKH